MTRLSPQVPAWAGSARILEAVDRSAWLEIGRSVRGRPIRAAAWGSGPTIVVVGAIHGDEPASALAVYRLAREAPTARARVVAVPILNPDGLSVHAKDNARGVDLNRNFPTSDFGTARRSGYDPGAAPASEPETQSLLRLLEREAPARVVAVHQPLACVNPDGPARAWAEEIAAACGLPLREDLGYPTPGSLGTYLGVERGIPVVTLELGRADPEAEWPRAARALWAAIGASTPGPGFASAR